MSLSASALCSPGLALWAAVGFFAGSLPLAVWIGRLFLKLDVRDYGDGNPGAANLWRAGGWRWGSTGVVVEVAKSAAPTYLAAQWGSQRGWAVMFVAMAPVFGHAFSPWLRFRGGKAIATVFGAWVAVLGVLGLVAFALSLGLMYAWQSSDAWTVVLGSLCFLLFLIVRGIDGPVLLLWGASTSVLVFRHWGELREGPRPRWSSFPGRQT